MTLSRAAQPADACVNKGTGQPKRGYRTKRQAKDAIVRAGRRGGRALEAYRCPSCGDWHIGHRPSTPPDASNVDERRSA